MNALADAIAAHCPPEREVSFDWPDAIRFDGGLLGGARLGWPADCAEDDVPAWLVFGVILRAADMAHVEEVQAASGVSLLSEGFEMIDTDAIIESFARHLMTAFDRWNERGFEAIARDYLERLPKRKAGERRAIDVNGDLLVRLARRQRAARCGAVLWMRWPGQLGMIRRRVVRNSDEADMLKFPRTIRLDPSDTFVFERAAEPGEWAVSGAFVFWNRDPATLGQKQRVALRSGFLGIDSLGWSTLAIVTEATEAERQAMVERLAAQLLEKFGAPDCKAARACRRGGDRVRGLVVRSPAADPARRAAQRRERRNPRALSHPQAARSRARMPIGCTPMPAPLPFMRSKATLNLPRRSIFSG